MKYILTFILIFFLGCSKKENSEEKKPIETNTTKTKQTKNKKTYSKIIIKINDFNLTIKNKKLIYPKKKIIFLFENNSTYSKMQEEVLNQMKLQYIKTDNEFLKKFFNIKTFPTIVVLDKNKTIKYENFVPLEILKAEGL
ncbi:hypothetical protein FE773_08590 [Caminibacter mediatlanticus TB-2]|uniref:Thioredoxin domain-containing protein n=1 Tax=Caminibacter mediatlanticus TB-2 TaxID=391592 RepID=A0AAI9F389_9BACT|nr:hypothetical protein [Caminibacter mediatlanticus]EDM24604.1 hypothetical protein CMTB2_03773 [Caminibacter mediatlanticus TB-2]QCT95247.1 hypothetical protein FE773_08590 [Caminibacter mediatlanticus TB-2]